MPAQPPDTGPSIAAFFDMDHTLLRGSSGRLYLRYLRQIGYLGWGQWIVIMSDVARYWVGITDFPRLMGRLMTRIAGAEETEAWRLSDAWFAAMLRHHISEQARQRVAWHAEQGHHVAIVSAATPYAVAPVAHHLELDYLATQLEIVEGRFTGRVVEPTCYGPGKVIQASAYAAKRGVDLRSSYFYTDSHHDLPLLEAVGHPVAVNPDRKLARISAQRRWPVIQFH